MSNRTQLFLKETYRRYFLRAELNNVFYDSSSISVINLGTLVITYCNRINAILISNQCAFYTQKGKQRLLFFRYFLKLDRDVLLFLSQIVIIFSSFCDQQSETFSVLQQQRCD